MRYRDEPLLLLLTVVGVPGVLVTTVGMNAPRVALLLPLIGLQGAGVVDVVVVGVTKLKKVCFLSTKCELFVSVSAFSFDSPEWLSAS